MKFPHIQHKKPFGSVLISLILVFTMISSALAAPWVANKLKSHRVYDPLTNAYVPGNTKGYTEGQASSFLVEVEGAVNDFLQFDICLDYNDSGAYFFTGLEPFDSDFLEDHNAPLPAGTLTGAAGDSVRGIDITVNSVTSLGVTGAPGADPTTLCPNNYIGWRVEFTLNQALGYLVYGGHLAMPTDPLPTGGTVPANQGASSISGVAQARIATLNGGDKTINFQPGDVAPASADLQVIKTCPNFTGPSPYPFVITVTNLGPGTTGLITVTDTLDDVLAYAGFTTILTTDGDSTPAGTCSAVGQEVTCILDKAFFATIIDATSKWTITLTTTIVDGTPDNYPIQNSATGVSDIPNQTIAEGNSFATINLDNYVTDVDNADSQLAWTYSGNTALTVSILNRIATITVPNADWYGSETITFKATDLGGLYDEDAATFTVTAVNDPPVVSDIPNQTIAEGSSFTTINLDNYVTDVDNADSQMTWSYSGNNLLSVSIDNRVATIGVPNADWNGSETITFKATDPSGLYDEDAVTFTVTAVNDSPVVSDIPNQTIAEGSSFAAISLDNFVSDVDNADSQIVWSYSGNSQLSVDITNRVATISVPDPVWNGSETITFKATDPGGLFDDDPATFTVTAVNSSPVVSDIPNQTIAEGSSFTTINLDNYVTDVDNTDSQISWTYSGNSQLAVNIINRVATISIPGSNWNGIETITFKATDPGGLYDEDAATFSVTAVNDAPVNTVPGLQTTLLDKTLVFSGVTLISISDVDIAETPDAMLQVTLNVNHGTLTLSQITGLLFTSGDGTSDNSLTFTGTIQDINAALNGLVYTPALGYTGNELLTIITNDQGYTGAGGSLSDTDTVAILVDELYQVYVPLIVK